MRIQLWYFLKMPFRFNYEVFLANLQKISKVGKNWESMMKECCSKKKRFHLFESLLYKNMKLLNKLVIAGRLVLVRLRHELFLIGYSADMSAKSKFFACSNFFSVNFCPISWSLILTITQILQWHNKEIPMWNILLSTSYQNIF